MATDAKVSVLRRAVVENGILKATRDGQRAAGLAPVFRVDLSHAKVANPLLDVRGI